MRRLTKCLNGLWDFCPGDGTLNIIPETWEETKIVVPSPWNVNSFAGTQDIDYEYEHISVKGGEYNLYPQYPGEWENANSGWYKTDFFADEEWRNNQIVLAFNAIHFYSEVYINGKKIHKNIDGFIPFEVFISDYIEYGEVNTLVVGVKKLELYYKQSEDGKKKVEYPTGSFWGCHIAGIWQDVFLKVYPETYIEDVFVHTDVNDNTLYVETELYNDKEENYTIEYVLKEYETDKQFVLGQICSNHKNKFIYSYDYESMKNEINLWWPDSPSLYNMDVILKKENEIIDIKTIRFGFKQLKIIGKKFYLNNIPINLRNDGWHYMGYAYQSKEYAKKWYKMAKEANVNCIRLHAQVYPEFFMEIADEMGMMIIDETSVWASHCEIHYSKEFFEHGKRHFEGLIKRDRNHPSVIIWSAENECIQAHKVTADNGVKDQDELYERLYDLVKYGEQFDSSRPIWCDGDYDLQDRLDAYSLHYPAKICPVETEKLITIGEMSSLYYGTPDFVCDYYGEKTFLSSNGRLEAIGRDVFENLRHQRKWAAQTCVFNIVWYGLDPMNFKEHIRKYDDYQTSGIKPTKIGPYISTLNAGYDEDLPDYIPNPIFDWARKAYIPERFFFEKGKSRYYNNEDGKKVISIHNDSLIGKEYEINYMIESDGEIHYSNAKKITVKPSCHKYMDIDFKLPVTERISKYILKVKMEYNEERVFEDYEEIKVYNPQYIAGRIAAYGKVKVLGNINEQSTEFLEKLGVGFINSNKLMKDRLETDILILGENVDSDMIDDETCDIIDFMPEKNGYASWVTRKKVEKVFVNVENNWLDKDIEEKDLYNWLDGNITEQTFKDYLNINSRAIFSTGKGFPVILDINSKNDRRKILSTINLLDVISEEPAAFMMLANLVSYSNRENIVKYSSAILISKKSAPLTEFFSSIGVEFRLIDVEDKKEIKRIRTDNTVIVDGTYNIDYMNELLNINTPKILLCNLKKENIPLILKGKIDIINKPLNQLIKEGFNNISNGIHLNNLYGLDPGDDMMLTHNPIVIKDCKNIKGILKNSNINWRLWNFQGEDRKTISIMRSELEEKQNLYGLAETYCNDIQVFISQLNYKEDSPKLNNLACKIFTNLGIRINKKNDNDIFDMITKEGIYKNKLVKSLILKTGDNVDPIGFSPSINKYEEEYDTYWNIGHLDNTKLDCGIYLYSFYVYSESDRTDLLLNPDLMGIKVDNESHKELYLNDMSVSKGESIVLSALNLKIGWNKIIIKEERINNDVEPVSIIFDRKDNDVLDLKFSIEPDYLKEIPNEQWEFVTNYNNKESENVTKGSGYFWYSIETQRDDMYFTIDMNDIYNVAKIQFDSRIDIDNALISTPRSYVLLGSVDNLIWDELYSVEDEIQLSYVDGKVILNINNKKVRYLKLLMKKVALKPLAIAGLKIYQKI